MKTTAKFTGKNAKTSSSARVVDGKLILSYPDAITPVVWQMDLATAKASALEVRESKNNFILNLKTLKGENAEIAPFATKEEAVAALMAASHALENAQGQIRPLGAVESTPYVTAPVQSAPVKKSRWAAGALGILLIIALIGVWGSMAPRAPRSVSNAASPLNGTSTAPAAPSGFNAPDEAGVPLSADDFLMKHQR